MRRSNPAKYPAEIAVHQTKRRARNAKAQTRARYAFGCKFCHLIPSLFDV